MELSVSAKWDPLNDVGRVEVEGTGAMAFDIPKEFGGKGSAPSPEHMFLASIAACMITTFIYMAKKVNLKVKDVRAKVSGKLERMERGGFRISNISAKIEVSVERGAEKDAEKCLNALNTYCIIKNTLDAPPRIQMELSVRSE